MSESSTAPAPLVLARFGDDSAGLFDPRCGFFVRVPGGPSLSEPSAPSSMPAQSEPFHEAVLTLAAIPVTLRYRLSELPAPRNPHAAIAMLAEVYAHNRCRADSNPRHRAATPAQLARWGVEAAASEVYPLAQLDADGADTEEVLMLYRRGQVVTLAQRFFLGRTAWASYTLLQGALSATLRFMDGPPPLPADAGPLWPASRFLTPGLTGALPAALRPIARGLREPCAEEADQLGPLFERLFLLFSSDEAPTHRLGEAEQRAIAEQLAGAAPGSRLGAALLAMLPSVETSHDLRGLCLFGLTAAGELPEQFVVEEPDADSPLGYLTE